MSTKVKYKNEPLTEILPNQTATIHCNNFEMESDLIIEVGLPEGYILPEGELLISENNIYDVKAYATVKVNVPMIDASNIEMYDGTITRV